MSSHLILQNVIFTKFALPFLLIFFIVFAILERTKVLGDNKQLSALTAFVIALIFVGAANQKEFVENMILFLTVAIVVAFVGLLLWGFVSGGELKIESTGLKWAAGALVGGGTLVAVLWASGIQGGVIDLLFYQSWSGTFWTNVLFIAVIAGALALVLRKND